MMRARQAIIILFGVLLVGGTLLFPPDASWRHVFRFSPAWDGDIAGADRLFQLLIVECLLVIGLLLSLGTRWRLNIGQHLALWTAIGGIVWIYLAPYPYATLYFRLYEKSDNASSVGVLSFLNYCLVIAGMAGILIGALEIARRMTDPPGNRYIKWTVRQRQAGLIGLTILGLLAFFPRSDLRMTYLLFTQHARYHASELVILWITGGVVLSGIIWSFHEGKQRLTLTQRIVVWLGALICMCFAVFPPTIAWYQGEHMLLFARLWEIIDIERFIQLEITVALITMSVLRAIGEQRPFSRTGIAVRSIGIGLLILSTLTFGNDNNPFASAFYDFGSTPFYRVCGSFRKPSDRRDGSGSRDGVRNTG